MKPYALIFIDLFWTAVDMDFSAFPRVRCNLSGHEEEHISSGDLLYNALRVRHPQVSREEFLRAFFAARKRVLAGWDEGEPEEISCTVKFLQLFEALRLQGRAHDLRLLADELTDIHMRQLIAATRLPPRRAAFLRRLMRAFPLVMISNFDHAPAGREILQRHGIHECFRRVVISDDLGKRKPHALIFEQAMRGFDVSPGDILMVGDTPHADIVGAKALGLETAWIQLKEEPWPAWFAPPDFVVKDLVDIENLPRIKALLD